MIPAAWYEPHRAAIRAEGFHVTPWRLGMRIGRLGLLLPSPYITQRSNTLYAEGWRYGNTEHEKLQHALWRELKKGVWYAR